MILDETYKIVKPIKVYFCKEFEAVGLASLAGFEPTARCLEGSCSVQTELQGQVICYSNIAWAWRRVKAGILPPIVTFGEGASQRDNRDKRW